jgi:hypothetical protein
MYECKLIAVNSMALVDLFVPVVMKEKEKYRSSLPDLANC